MNWTVPPLQYIRLEWEETLARLREWLQGQLFSFQWWVLLALFIISIYLWWKLADKTRLTEIATYNAIVILFILALDEIGLELMLWYYPKDLFFLFPPATAVDIICMPLVYMAIYRYFRAWKSFLIATAIMSVVFCFVIEPIFVWGGAYVMLNWKGYYGLPFYFSIAVASKLIVNAIFTVSSKHQGRKTAG